MDIRQQIESARQALPSHHPSNMAVHMEPPKKTARSVTTFRDAQAAIAGTLEAWLPRLVESNEALQEALLLLRDLHFARQSVAEEVVLEKVQDALNKAANAMAA
jgi:hypothetical protein